MSKTVGILGAGYWRALQGRVVGKMGILSIFFSILSGMIIPLETMCPSWVETVETTSHGLKHVLQFFGANLSHLYQTCVTLGSRVHHTCTMLSPTIQGSLSEGSRVQPLKSLNTEQHPSVKPKLHPTLFTPTSYFAKEFKCFK
jgi:hypothetical protein